MTYPMNRRRYQRQEGPTGISCGRPATRAPTAPRRMRRDSGPCGDDLPRLAPALLCCALAAALGLNACATLRDGVAAGSDSQSPVGVEQPPTRSLGEGDAQAGAEIPLAASPDRGEGARTFVFECEGGGTDAPEGDASIAPAGGATADQVVGDSLGETADALTFIARIEGETAWLFLPRQTVSLPHVQTASGARYADGGTAFWSRADEATLEWRGERSTGCRNNPRSAVWEHAKLSGVDFRAVGQEPGWHLEIRRADTVVLVSDYGTARHTFPWTEPVDDPRALRTAYWMQSGPDELKVVLELGPCYDTMSGEQFETRVTVWLNGRELTGCGRALH